MVDISLGSHDIIDRKDSCPCRHHLHSIYREEKCTAMTNHVVSLREDNFDEPQRSTSWSRRMSCAAYLTIFC